MAMVSGLGTLDRRFQDSTFYLWIGANQANVLTPVGLQLTFESRQHVGDTATIQGTTGLPGTTLVASLISMLQTETIALIHQLIDLLH